MFSIFRTKNKASRIAVSETEFWARLESDCTDRSVFDAQGDEHSEIDMRLVDKIDALLHPQIGDWESSDDWYHKLDFYGDGIRSLLFNWAVFKPDFIEALQDLLSGEHEPFCVLCQIYEDIGSDDDSKIGSIAIFRNQIMISRPIAKRLAFAS